MTAIPLQTVELRLEADTVLARQRARQIAGLLGLPPLDQTRVATATSEIVRNAFDYAGGGKVEFLIETGPAPAMVIRVRERGTGIENLQLILGGHYKSATGLGIGIIGAKRLMDRFEVEANAGGGSVVTLAKNLPKSAAVFSPHELAQVAAELARNAPKGLLEELQLQNQELLRTLQELRERQAELAHMHAKELDETNRGVVALYTELDENAKTLQRVSDLKTRFLSNMSHEFRSPLNTILSLCGFLLERSDGELTSEQDKQVRFIRKAAEGLTTLVNDLLDIAKVEAGKAVVRAARFEVADLFENLRGTIRPLLAQSPVSLVFEEPVGVPPLLTDEGKVAQILRNFLSNAVKYTPAGEIRISAIPGANDTVVFTVADTGIGIDPENQRLIFEEFVQVEGPLQGRIKGTGLGLPLSRKLAELLGGAVSVRSEPGAGSSFSVVIPRVHQDGATTGGPLTKKVPRRGREPSTLLVVGAEPDAQRLDEQALASSGFCIMRASDVDEVRRILAADSPAAVLLEIQSEDDSGWKLLAELTARQDTSEIPVIVVAVADLKERALMDGAHDFLPKPADSTSLLNKLTSLCQAGSAETILVIDDEENCRYILKEVLAGLGRYTVIEASTGLDGLRHARELRPEAIFLDLVMPETSGFEILEQLKGDAATRGIPVIIYTSIALQDEDRSRLERGAATILSKVPGDREEHVASVRQALAKAGISAVASKVES
ncbi:MAG: ATP-binding protein [Isosphaeraceae bacterium]|nr:ATP-binding protein [Isosphaeraceae bacterium]